MKSLRIAAIITALGASILGCGFEADRYDQMSYRRAIRKIKNIDEARHYMQVHLDYISDDHILGYKKSEHIPSFKRVHDKGLDDCDGYAVAPAALLSDDGYLPILLSFNNTDGIGHCVYVWEKENNELGVLDNVNGRSSFKNLDELIGNWVHPDRPDTIRLSNIGFHYPDWITTSRNMKDIFDEDPVKMPDLEYVETTPEVTITTVLNEFAGKLSDSDFILAAGYSDSTGNHIVDIDLDTKVCNYRKYVQGNLVSISAVGRDILYQSYNDMSKIFSVDGTAVIDGNKIEPENPDIFVDKANNNLILFRLFNQPKRIFIYDTQNQQITEITDKLPEHHSQFNVMDGKNIGFLSTDAVFLNLETEKYSDRGLQSHLFRNRKVQMLYANKDSFLIKTSNMNAFYNGKEWKQIPKSTGIFSEGYHAELKGDKIFFLDGSILKVLDTKLKKLIEIAKDVIMFKSVKDGSEVYFNQNYKLKHAEGF